MLLNEYNIKKKLPNTQVSNKKYSKSNKKSIQKVTNMIEKYSKSNKLFSYLLLIRALRQLVVMY